MQHSAVPRGSFCLPDHPLLSLRQPSRCPWPWQCYGDLNFLWMNWSHTAAPHVWSVSSFSAPHTFSLPKASRLLGHGVGAGQGQWRLGQGSSAGATAAYVQLRACPAPTLLPEVVQKENPNPNAFQMGNPNAVCAIGRAWRSLALLT